MVRILDCTKRTAEHERHPFSASWVHSNVTGHLVLPTMPFLKLICQVFCHRKEKSSYHNYTVVRRHIQRFTMEPFPVGFRAEGGMGCLQTERGNSKSWGSGCSHEWYCVLPGNQKRQEMCLLILKVGLILQALPLTTSIDGQEWIFSTLPWGTAFGRLGLKGRKRA